MTLLIWKKNLAVEKNYGDMYTRVHALPFHPPQQSWTLS